MKTHVYDSGVYFDTAPEDVIGCCNEPRSAPVHDVRCTKCGQQRTARHECPPMRVGATVRIVEDAIPELVGLEAKIDRFGPDGTTAWLVKDYGTRVQYGVWCSVSALEVLTDQPPT